MFNYNRHMKRFHSQERWELLDRVPSPSTRHVLEETGPAAKTRKRCVGCYKNLTKDSDSRTAAKRAKRINTRCSQCKKHFCLDCFNISHIKCNS
ncbi:hypothetical protein KIN20_038400 [Parelaphostrongylus tenuis]|uniref:Uncharacterized protein n=1 Tax=Parelaphostrongylus tenuis TaxID=148309 RepID=A0AAD5MWV2_PARTN|nr:hypothetical protein KIN20_038400 [Parelaphostrongylus tenuis]